MSNSTASLDRINQLKSEIAQLEKAAISELMQKRNGLSQQLAEVDAEIARLSGKPVEGRKSRSSAPGASGKSPSLQELKEVLTAAPDKTLNIRREGYDLKNIKVLAAANPQLLKLGGKGPWPTVSLLK